MATTYQQLQEEREAKLSSVADAQAQSYQQLQAQREAAIGGGGTMEQASERRQSAITPSIQGSGGIASSGGIQGSGGLQGANDSPAAPGTIATGAFGNTSTARPAAGVRAILEKGGPEGRRETNRLMRFRDSTAGKNFDFGNFQSSLLKLRRGTLGQQEWDRQMSVAFNEQPALAVQSENTEFPEADTPETEDPNNVFRPITQPTQEPVAGSADSVFTPIEVDDSSVDTTEGTAMIDSLDSIDSLVFETQSLA